MAEATTNTTTIIARADQHDIDLHKASDRVNFGSIREPIDVPYLLGVQTDSFDWLIGNERWQKRVEEDLANGTNTVPHTSGLDEVFQEISPIENFAQTMSLTFSDPYFEEPRHTVQECKEKDYTYSAPLYVNAEFENGDTGEIKSQTVFMGDFPLQTPHGTFIIGGTERVIVSQLVRSPGVYFDRQQDRTSDKEVFGAKIIPSRGAWLEFEIDKRDVLGVRVDRKRKQSAIVFLMAIGMTKDEIADAFKDYPLVMDALAKETVQTQDEAHAINGSHSWCASATASYPSAWYHRSRSATESRLLFDATPSPRYGSRLASASGNARNVSMSIQDSIGEPPNEMFNRPTGTPSHWRILRPKKYASAEKSSSVSASQPCQNARS